MVQETRPQIQFQNDEISLRDIVLKVREWIAILKSKWLYLLIAGVIGGSLGFAYASFKKTTYKAELVFVTAEADKGGLGKLSALGSQFGFDLGGGSSGAFGGDNLLELMKSRRLVEQTLFDSLEHEGRRYRLLEYYLFRDSSLRGKSKTPAVDLSGIDTRKDCGFRQDSLLKEVYDLITKKALVVEAQDKDLAFKRVEFSDIDPVFAKNFVERLTENVTAFYLETKTRQSRENIRMLERKADSIERVLQSKMVSAAIQRDQNQFLTNAQGTVQMVKQQMEVQMLTTMYGEVVKNLELSKTMAAIEEPLIQVIDVPRYPLEDDGGKGLLFFILGGVLGFLFIVVRIIVNMN
jgi:uncharacterized protein involved in exopolysaccharide biosynthesis